MLKKLRTNQTLRKIVAWIDNNYIVKVSLAALIETGKHLLQSLLFWLTGWVLIHYFANLSFISFYQMIFLTMWFKIINFNLNQKITFK